MTTTLEPPATTTETAERARPPAAHPPTWDRIRFGVLLAATAVTYLWNITVNGMGNQFYAGAAQAGSKNWEALLFGSLDTQNFMTVDKPPVSQWVMGLSGQIFGFSSASMLIPEALMAVATVALLYAAVRRISGPNAALLAGAAFALTPVAALMFRFNNPDAVMVLLMMAAVYCAVRALEHASATVDRAGRRRARLRVPGQDARGHHGDARDRSGLSRRRADRRSARGCCTSSGRWSPSSSRRAGSSC